MKPEVKRRYEERKAEIKAARLAVEKRNAEELAAKREEEKRRAEAIAVDEHARDAATNNPGNQSGAPEEEKKGPEENKDEEEKKEAIPVDPIPSIVNNN